MGSQPPPRVEMPLELMGDLSSPAQRSSSLHDVDRPEHSQIINFFAKLFIALAQNADLRKRGQLAWVITSIDS